MVTTYKPSGAGGMSSLMSLVLVAPLVAVSAVVYQGLIWVIPLIYIEAFIVLGYAVGLGALARLGMRWTRCRNLPVATLSGCMLGLLAVAASHGAAFVIETASQHRFGNISFADFIHDKVARGWSFGRFGSGGGLPVQGVFVWIVWGIEAVVLVAGAVLGARTAAGTPFCETCGVWADKTDTVHHVLKPTPDSLARVRTGERVVDLLDAQPGGIAMEELGYTLRCCPACGKVPTLSVELRTTKIEGKKQSTTKQELHKYVMLIPEEAEEVRAMAKEAGRGATPAAATSA